LPDPLPLLTARTRLRRLADTDLGRFQQVRHDAAVRRWQGWPVLDDAAAAAFLQEQAASAFGVPGHWCQIAMAERHSDLLLGDIGLQLHGSGPLVAEIGFTLAPAVQGRGLATEAVGALVQWLLQQRQVLRIVAVADAANERSLRLLARLGFRAYAELPGAPAQARDGPPPLQRRPMHHLVLHRPQQPPVLRAARPADAAAVAEVLRLSRRVLMPFAPSPHSDADQARWVAQVLLPGGGVTVAERNGTVVGVLALRHGADAGWIEQLYVHPAQAASGVGSALLRHALEAHERHATAAHGNGLPLRLYTFAANTHARAFYERHGFVAVAFGDGSDNEERQPDVLYERSAGASSTGADTR
jgi:RimJ/RimL family protein N-acetyltransferase